MMYVLNCEQNIREARNEVEKLTNDRKRNNEAVREKRELRCSPDCDGEREE